MSCWASAFVSFARTASFIASSSNSSAETSPSSRSAASRAASSSREARTGKTSITSSSSTTRTREPRNGSDSTRRISCEVAERLPDGRLARPELLRDPRLDEALARLQLAARDPLEEYVLHLLAQDGARDGRHRLQPATTGLVISPTPSIWIVTVSPGRRRRFGSRKTPTPAGVPVRIRSPASRVDVREA